MSECLYCLIPDQFQFRFFFLQSEKVKTASDFVSYIHKFVIHTLLPTSNLVIYLSEGIDSSKLMSLPRPPGAYHFC